MMNPHADPTLQDFDERIRGMELRLQNAKASRDAYVQYLQRKYPDWNQKLSNHSFSLKQSLRTPLVNRLSTSEYYWDLNPPHRRRAQLPQMTLYNEIPSSGPFLESDIMNTKRRLKEISAQLRSIRGDRMSMSTVDYSAMLPFSSTQREPISLLTAEEESINRIDFIRQRLSQLDFPNYSPVVTPTEEEIESMKFADERNQMINDIKTGIIPRMSEYSTAGLAQNLGHTNNDNAMKPVVKFEQSPPSLQEVQHVPEQSAPIQPIQQSTQQTLQKEKEKQKSPEPAASAYSQMMSLLSTKKEESSSDESDEPEPISAPKNLLSTGPSKPSASGTSLLSQFLINDDDSSEDDIKLAPTSKKSMSKMYQEGNDSADDFFN